MKGVKMQNLNQIRARHVLEFANIARVKGNHGGEVIKKIPPVIMNNGIMAALAYSMDKNQQAWRLVFDAISVHLSSKEISMIPEDRNSAEMLLDYLASEASSTMLRNVTAEAGEWLNFARRLVK
jgi:CRISPR/Cas system CMR-associated protein Cmr5 small subunit